MTKKELVEMLKDLPDDLPILTRGYESGWELAKGVEVRNVFFDEKAPWYEGTYQDIDVYDENLPEVEAIIISD